VFIGATNDHRFRADLPPAPALLDVMIGGKRVPVLVQTAKTGWMYILDRVTVDSRKRRSYIPTEGEPECG
jgi:glucose dehydrogenase